MFSQLPIISPFAQALGASPLLTGLAIGGYSFSNMFGNVLAGRWIDRLGAKKILVTGMGITGLIILLYTMVETGEQLVGVRLIHGLSAGLMAPSAFTLMSGLASQNKQGKNMALSGAAVGIAAILGPAYSGIMSSKFGLEVVFLTVSALLLICALAAWIWLPNTRPDTIPQSDPIAQPVSNIGSSQQPKQQRQNRLAELGSLFGIRPLVNAYLGSFSLMFALGIVAYMLPLKVDALGLNSAISGMLLSTFGVVAIIIFVTPINKIFDRFEPQKVMLIGLFIVVLSLVLVSIFNNQALLFIALGIFGSGFALMFPSMNKIIVTYVDEENRGKAFGLFYALFSLGVVIGSFTVGALATTPDGAFLLGAGIILIIGLYGSGRYFSDLRQLKEQKQTGF